MRRYALYRVPVLVIIVWIRRNLEGLDVVLLDVIVKYEMHKLVLIIC